MLQSQSRPLALITGASSGIGAAYAERLALAGYDLILVARRRERLEALAEKLRTTGAEAEALPADLTDPDVLHQLELRVARDDRLTLLVNNAGFGGYRRFVEVEPRVIDELISIHVRTIARLTRAALPTMNSSWNRSDCERCIDPGAERPATTGPVAISCGLRRGEGIHFGLYGSIIRRAW